MASEEGSEGKEPATTSKTGGSDEGPMRSGVCKWFNVLKGWGFITPDEGGQEVFVHQRVVQMPGFRSLGEGERVEFQCHETERGLEATTVTGPGGADCVGSSVRPLGKKKYRRIRCYNCGQFGNHTASKCRLGQLPKCCYHCKSTDHLIADCPERSKQGEAAGEEEESLAEGTSDLPRDTAKEGDGQGEASAAGGSVQEPAEKEADSAT